MPSGWLNVPHYKQEFNYSCMAACVRMVLAHQGRSLSEAELRQLLNTQPSGTTPRNLTALGPLGLDVQLAVSNLSQLRDMLAAGLPPLVFVDTGPLEYWQTDCAHVAVLVGMDDTSVYLNDPFFDSAPQQSSLASFLQAWALNAHLAAILRPRP
ncbi:MAG: peptidase C39 family protein [Planctomycetes bacterium]|nr:peptidase C39 family protein [Planctomycetota bacterium]